MDRMDADALGDRGQRQPLHEMEVDERARLSQPQRRVPTDARTVKVGDATRGFGQDAERETLNREARHLVPQTELTVQPMREMEDEPAAKRRGAREHRRLVADAAEPRRVDVDEEARRARRPNHVRVRLLRAPEQQRRWAVRRGVVAANLRHASRQHEHEPHVRVHVTGDAPAGFVLDFREHESGDAAPSQDGAVREILRRQRGGRHCVLGRSAGGCIWYSCGGWAPSRFLTK